MAATLHSPSLMHYGAQCFIGRDEIDQDDGSAPPAITRRICVLLGTLSFIDSLIGRSCDRGLWQPYAATLLRVLFSNQPAIMGFHSAVLK